MRTLLLPLFALLAGCGPHLGYAGLHGTTSVTIAGSGGGGDGVARAGPLDAKACWWRDKDETPMLSLRLGPDCVLAAPWVERVVGGHRVAIGGDADVTSGQRCVLTLGDTKTALTVQRRSCRPRRTARSTRPSAA